MFAPKVVPMRLPSINGRITLISRSLSETNILAKLEPSWIIPWIGTRANGGKIKDKLTSISIPPPKLRAVEINEQNKFNIIKKTAPHKDIVSGKKEIMLI